MSSFHHLLLALCAIALAGVVGLVAAMLGVPPNLGKVIGGGVAGAAYLYLETRRERREGREGHARVPRRAREPYVSPFEVRFDDTEVVVMRNGELFERVAWDDLITVGVSIDDGFLPQPWWMLFSGGLKGAHYPSEARGAREMLHELQRRLPGFDNGGVIRAMGMMDGGVVVWQRAGTTGAPR